MKNWTDKNLKVGDNIVNKYGDHGTVTWVADNGVAATYKVYDYADDSVRPSSTCPTACDLKAADNVRLAVALSKLPK